MQSSYTMSGNVGTLTIQYEAASMKFDCILWRVWVHLVREPTVRWRSNFIFSQRTRSCGVRLAFIRICCRSAPY